MRSIFKSLLRRNQQGFAFFSLGRVSGEAASSMRRLGGYLANGRKPPVRAPFASREKRRRLANRAFEAHALCGKRMSDAPYENHARKPPWHLLPGGWLMPRQVDAGSRIRFSAFRGDASNRPFFWSAVSAGNGCPTRYDAPYGNYAWKPPWHLLPGGWPRTRQDRRTLGTESGSAPFAATSPTVRSFGVLFLRKANARCALRNQARKPVPASPSRRLANAPTSGRREQNSVQRLSRRS